MSHHNQVHPDRLIARSRRWTRGAIAATGAATLGLTGWIAFSTETASATTHKTTTTSASKASAKAATHKAHHQRPTASSNSGSSSTYTPTNSTNSSTPVQGTTSGS